MEWLSARRREKNERRKEIAADILVILVIVKFALEFAIKYGGIASYLGAAFMVAGILALAIRWGGLRNIISIGAIGLFLIDYHLKAGAGGSVILITMVLVLIAFYFILKFIG